MPPNPRAQNGAAPQDSNGGRSNLDPVLQLLSSKRPFTLPYNNAFSTDRRQ